MDIELAKRLMRQLTEYEFQLLSAGDEYKRLFFMKITGAILYFIAVTDDNAPYPENEAAFQKCMAFYKNLCSRFVFVHIILSENAGEVFQKTAHAPFFPEESVHKIVWVVDVLAHTILVPEGTPSEILNIKKILLDSFSQNAAKTPPPLTEKSQNAVFTMGLIVLNIAIFIGMSLFLDQRMVFDFFALSPYQIWVNGQYYRMFTSAFLHADISHIAYNSLSIYIFGTRCEKYFGKIPFLMIYFFSVLCSGVCSALASPGISVGASGGAFGLIAAVFVLSVKKKKSIGQMDMHTIFIMLAGGLLLGLMMPNIDNYAHLGGIIGGILAAMVMLRIHK